jgi:hypothetical protein
MRGLTKRNAINKRGVAYFSCVNIKKSSKHENAIERNTMG